MRHDIFKAMHLNFEYPLSQISFLSWRVYDTVLDVAEKEVQLRSDFQSGSRGLKRMNPILAFFVNRASVPLCISLEMINDITQNGFRQLYPDCKSKIDGADVSLC